MMSEKEFSTGFSGFWAECLPFLTPQVIAEYNLGGIPMKKKHVWVKPLSSSLNPLNNDLIAEIAFEIFATAYRSGYQVRTVVADVNKVEIIQDAAIDRINKLRRHQNQEDQYSPAIAREAAVLAQRLEDSLQLSSLHPIIIQPHFKGCGILRSCYGDLLASRCLYEVKMVDRNLRSADIKQLLTYCSLNYISRQFDINYMVILNPRRGVEYEFDIEEFASRISGRTSGELFHHITKFLEDFETTVLPS